jgi:hypothetical protein
MERCNRPAWRTYPNGYRVCWDHSQPFNPDETRHENSVGPCDYPIDGRGAERYDARMRKAGKGNQP